MIIFTKYMELIRSPLFLNEEEVFTVNLKLKSTRRTTHKLLFQTVLNTEVSTRVEEHWI